jgi:hypothetical protein
VYKHSGNKASIPKNTAKGDRASGARKMASPGPASVKAKPEAWNPGGEVSGPKPGRGEGGNGSSRTVGSGTTIGKRGPASEKGTRKPLAQPKPKVRKDFQPGITRF